MFYCSWIRNDLTWRFEICHVLLSFDRGVWFPYSFYNSIYKIIRKVSLHPIRRGEGPDKTGASTIGGSTAQREKTQNTKLYIVLCFAFNLKNCVVNGQEADSFIAKNR